MWKASPCEAVPCQATTLHPSFACTPHAVGRAAGHSRHATCRECQHKPLAQQRRVVFFLEKNQHRLLACLLAERQDHARGKGRERKTGRPRRYTQTRVCASGRDAIIKLERWASGWAMARAGEYLVGGMRHIRVITQQPPRLAHVPHKGIIVA